MNTTFRRNSLIVLAASTTVVFTLIYAYFNHNDEEASYRSFITNHPYLKNDPAHEDYRSIPKFDRPDLAAQHEFLLTVDPKLKIVPRQRLWTAYEETQQRLARKTTVPLQIDDLSKPNWKSVQERAIPDVVWRERGPDNIGGRTRTIMWDPNDPNVRKVWTGSVSGGIWFNNDILNSNSAWQQVDDFLPNLTISSLAFDPTNTTTFYAGTGEGYFSSGGAGAGAGLYRSTDGGQNWALLSSTSGPGFRYIQKVKVTDAGTVLITTRQSTNEGGQPGVYRSTDDGNSWTRVLSGRAGDMELASNGDVYVATGLAFGEIGRLFRSVDDGLSWTEITPPFSTQTRIELAVAPSQSSSTETTRVYAVAQDRSNFVDVAWFLRSDDGGDTWGQLDVPRYREQNCQQSSDDFTRGQSFYDLILAVNPTDDDVITMGGINVLRSSDGGINASEVSYWTGRCDDFVHADIHEIIFRPGFSNEALVGTDGGVYYSPDLGNSFDPSFEPRLRNFSVTQFYAVTAANETDNTDYFLAGSQDNGTQQFTSQGGLSTSQATGGDGGYTHIDQTDDTYQVTSFVRNTVFHSANGGFSFRTIVNDQSSGLFINPTDLDNSSHILYSAGNEGELFRLLNINTPSPSSQEKMTLSIGRVTHVQANAFTDHRVFVGNTAGEVYRIDNANSITPQVTEISGGISAFGSVSSVAIGANDDQLIVTYSNFGVSSVWYTEDGGASWTNKDQSTHGLPDMPIRWAIFAPNNTSQVLLATELGVWSSDNILADNPGWEPTNDDLANVRCTMLRVRSVDNAVVVATFGRGVFTTNSFSSTNDETPPSIVSLSPADGALDVDRDENLTITFNESVRAGLGVIEIKRSSDDSVFETIDVLSGDVTFSGTTATINPANTLESFTSYYINVSNGAITDLAENEFGLNDKTTWNFTTIESDLPPTVANPLPDLRVVINENSSLTIDLSNVFTDPDNDDNAITKSVTSNSNDQLLTTTVNGDQLTLNITPDLRASTLIRVEANSNGQTVTDAFFVIVGEPTLVSQFDNRNGSGLQSQQFTDNADAIVQLADDFQVPAGEIWDIQNITVFGGTNTETFNTFGVEIYGENTGFPDDFDLIYSELVNFTQEPGNLIAQLPVDVQNLPEGRYWVSVYAVTTTANSWVWGRAEPVTGSELVLNDREGIFANTTANEWIPGSDVDVFDEDLAFSIHGVTEVPPAAPSDVTVTEATAGTINIAWTDNSDNETGFTVFRQANGEEGEALGTVTGTTFEDNTAATNTSYTYSVRAENAFNSDLAAAEAFLTLPAAPTVTIAQLLVDPNFTFIIEWESNDGATEFELDVSTDNFATFLNGFESFPTTETGVTFENMPPADYQVRVRAVNSAGVSPNSEVQETTITTDVDDLLEKALNVYPNPAVDQLTIDLPAILNGEAQLDIYNLSGSSVMKAEMKATGKDQLVLDVREINRGIYLLVVQGDQYRAQARFVKK